MAGHALRYESENTSMYDQRCGTSSTQGKTKYDQTPWWMGEMLKGGDGPGLIISIANGLEKLLGNNYLLVFFHSTGISDWI